jgi:cytochrome P450
MDASIPISAWRPQPFPFGDAQDIEIPPEFAVLRRLAPLVRIALPNDREAWLATTYAANEAVMTDHRLRRSSAADPAAPRLTPVPPDASALAIRDGRDHARLRRFAARALTARRIAHLSRRMEQIADTTIDALSVNGCEAELMADYATPFPMQVICEILGIPYADRDRFAKSAGIFFATTAFTASQMADAAADLSSYLTDLVDDRRGKGGDDFVTSLTSRLGGDALTDDEVVMLCATLLTAGYENVANAIGTFVWVLLTRPSLRRAAAESLANTAQVVDELLRRVPANLGVTQPRFATEDIELCGVKINKGDAIFASPLAANHDPNVYPLPEDIDLQRKGPKRHLAFSLGPHHCLGEALARREIETAVYRLLQRLPTLRVSDAAAVEWLKGRTMRGPASLPVQW